MLNVLIEDSLSPDTIEMVPRARDATEVITRLAGKLAGRLGIERQQLEQAIQTRERARTTALANAAAVPHCRLPDLETLGIAMMILDEPIVWDDEGHRVEVVMMIAGPSRDVAEHLRLLANSSQLLDSAALRSKLKRAPDPQAVHRLVVAAEQAIERRRTVEGMLREVRNEHANGVDYLRTVADQFEW